MQTDGGVGSIPKRAFAKDFPKSEVQVDLLAHLSVANSWHCGMLLRPAGCEVDFTVRKW
jgi:hypothetical protein